MKDKSKSKTAPGPLVEGRDYYIENGLYVFTAYYLQQRGYCCKSGCRHCPYGGDVPGRTGEVTSWEERGRWRPGKNGGGDVLGRTGEVTAWECPGRWP